MNWHGLQDFLAMGGYGSYVWGSFSVVFGLMILEVWALGRRERATQAAVANHGDEGAP
ncbi:heme exporter protein D [Duganella sp. CF458]|uniref:heme exporter protein CcmD n=1 Tax=Duganella sp. CF458 TaxID=1884368 RepID=UPI0008DF603A|nr:heme exporter protein CcmD [Duganella sp. CF458]SFG44786.1 heme exporter protein D [Duganella sp. CF458]